MPFAAIAFTILGKNMIMNIYFSPKFGNCYISIGLIAEKNDA